VENETRRFDVVILGGGSAGCVLAARLSEDPETSVLVAEAGPDVLPGAVPEAISSPYPGKAYFNPDWTWPTLRVILGSAMSNSAPRAVRPYEQARVMGGGSSINGIGANRGAPSDFDEWEAMGAAGWGWSEVLPYFRKLERDLDYGSDGELHNGDGPVPIRRIPRTLHAGFIRDVETELASRGYARHEDQNGPWQDGLFPIATNLDEAGHRASAATAYLTAEVRRRPNLTIWPDTKAERVPMEGRRAVGAELRRQDGSVRVAAGLVVVSAGALHSPALLLRSGIGAPAALAKLGIAVAVRRDAVGRNLQEHPSIGLSAYMPKPSRPVTGDQYHIQSVLRWSSGQDGAPAGDMHLAMNMRSGWHAVGSRLGLLFNWVNKSYSHGMVTLAAADPAVEPEVDFRLLSDRRDLLRLADAFRLAASTLLAMQARGECLDVFPSTYSAKVKKWLAPSFRNGAVMSLVGPAMDAVSGVRHAVLRSLQEGMPSLELLLRDEAELHGFLRRNVGGVWHPSGTCRMGATDDPAAVCDPDGRVIGAEGLMVCDASVMPSIPCANLNIPVLMIAEKIADGIRARQRQATPRMAAE
jgi:5-(hydroxymethyl)furfural/furfural oxidase